MIILKFMFIASLLFKPNFQADVRYQYLYVGMSEYELGKDAIILPPDPLEGEIVVVDFIGDVTKLFLHYKCNSRFCKVAFFIYERNTEVLQYDNNSIGLPKADFIVLHHDTRPIMNWKMTSTAMFDSIRSWSTNTLWLGAATTIIAVTIAVETIKGMIRGINSQTGVDHRTEVDNDDYKTDYDYSISAVDDNDRQFES